MNTKHILVTSLKELLRSRPIGKITVDMIIRPCGIARSTFYRHFTDKYALLAYYYVERQQDILSRLDQDRITYRDALLASCQAYASDKDYFCEAIKTSGQNSLRQTLHDYSVRNTRVFIESRGGNYEGELELLLDGYITAFLRIVELWLVDYDGKLPIEAVTDAIYQMLPEKCKKYFQ